MLSERPKIFWFNWPGRIGGADTKFDHTLRLLAGEYDITVIPGDPRSLTSKVWTDFLRRLDVRWCLPEDIPDGTGGWAISLCNGNFFKDGVLGICLKRKLRVIWSSEMMWHFTGELEAVRFGLIERVIYVSPAQRTALEPGYLRALSGKPEVPEPVAADFPAGGEDGTQGILTGPCGSVKWIMAGNYIDPRAFPFRQRGSRADGIPFTLGRVSRPDPDKFPDDFPLSYERLGLRDPARFRVLGWSSQMAERWPDHVYDGRWELIPAGGEDVRTFLDSLDIMVYDLSPRLRESWGRAVVEAMLSGVVPLVPAGGGHHLDQLVPHGTGGFVCAGPDDYIQYAKALQDDPALLARLSAGAREQALTLCGREDHLERWRQVFDG